MAVFSAYGPHEPIVALVHKNDPSIGPTDATSIIQQKKTKKVSIDPDKKTEKMAASLRHIARALNTVTAFTTS